MRRSDSLHRHGEPVADATFGPDNARSARTGLELAAQPQNLHVDAAVRDILMQVRGLQQVFAAERALCRVEKDNQQDVLTFGQQDRIAGRISEPPRRGVELPARKSKMAALRSMSNS